MSTTMTRGLMLVVAVVLAGCPGQSAKDAGIGGGQGGGFLGGGGGFGGGGATGGGAGGGGGGGGVTGGGTGGGTVTGGGTGGGGEVLDAGTDAGTDAGATGGGTGVDAGCVFTPTADDAVRHVVVSHPFPPDGGSRDNRWELFSLSPAGVLTKTGTLFRMGRSSDGTSPIIFTADGRFGYVAQEDGTIGVFRIDGDTVTVVDPGYTGGFSAGKLVMQPSGHQLWVTDFDTQGNHGGVYSVDIACDGTLMNEQYVLPGDNASAAVLAPDAATLLVASRSLAASPLDQDLHLVDVTQATPSVVTSTTGFPDRDAIPSTVTTSRDGTIIALPDNGYSVGSRIAFFTRAGNTLTAKAVVNTPNPYSVTFSPFGDVGLVVNSDGNDNFRRLTWNAAAGTFTVSAALAYVNGRPQLPSAPVMLTRGALTGRMLIAELDSVRQLQFQPDGGITDVSKTAASGTSSEQILGTIGVTP
jgi:hypothetical protein